jgi:hypothetical protein
MLLCGLAAEEVKDEENEQGEEYYAANHSTHNGTNVNGFG